MNHIPKGFKKMAFEHHVPKRCVEIIEQYFMNNLLCSFHICYTKKPEFKTTDKFWVVKYYCKPKDEANITYYLGIYWQTVFNTHTKKGLKNPAHYYPDDYLEQICIVKKKKQPHGK